VYSDGIHLTVTARQTRPSVQGGSLNGPHVFITVMWHCRSRSNLVHKINPAKEFSMIAG